MSEGALSSGTVRRLAVSLALATALGGVLWLGHRTPVEPAAAHGTAGTLGEDGVLELVPSVRGVYPHDATAYTQGLLWHEGSLYESTGLYGQSSLRRVETTSGRVEKAIDLTADLFGEGLELVEDRLYQLTWREGVALEWSLEGFEPVARYSYGGEGWGLCYASGRLIRSDGSDHLFFHAPEDFSPRGSVAVRLRGEPVARLNELECAEGWVYANIYGSERIVRIDADTGRVDAVIDASGLVDPELARAGVLNGIAYNAERRTFYLTGKHWSKLFEVVFLPAG
jgi:glutaminyl-peptide cyclotransferase